jgi:hypothetical protein
LEVVLDSSRGSRKLGQLSEFAHEVVFGEPLSTDYFSKADAPAPQFRLYRIPIALKTGSVDGLASKLNVRATLTWRDGSTKTKRGIWMHNQAADIELVNDGVAEDLDVFQESYEWGVTAIPYWHSGQASESVLVGDDGLDLHIRLTADGFFSVETTWRIERAGRDWTIQKVER